jgi:tRNA(Ile)-lysidine synthase
MGPHPAVAAVRGAVRAALQELEPGDLVMVACSGGADSLALAAATAFEAPKAGLTVGAVTVDHGLQDGSAEHALAVAETLRGLGLAPVEIVRAQVGTAGGPEAAARTARYRALDEAADRLGAAAVLLGHSRDDQAETVLLGLARGSGARSLAGMAPVSGRYRRPLLDLDRATLREACTAAGLEPWEDPHNADPSFARVRLRREALPALERALGPGVAAALARTARLLRDDADALDAWAAEAAQQCRDPQGDLECASLSTLPPAVRRRVLRAEAIAAGSPPGELFAVHVDALDDFVVRWHGQQHVDLPGRVTARRLCGRLHLARDP